MSYQTNVWNLYRNAGWVTRIKGYLRLEIWPHRKLKQQLALTALMISLSASLTYRPLKSEILSIKHPSSSTATTSPAVCINKSTRSDITIAHHHQRWSINQWTMVKCTYWINNIVEKEKNQNLRLAILFKIIENTELSSSSIWMCVVSTFTDLKVFIKMKRKI